LSPLPLASSSDSQPGCSLYSDDGGDVRPPDKLLQNLSKQNGSRQQFIKLLPRRGGGSCANHQGIGKDRSAPGASALTVEVSARSVRSIRC
jgi:hypothetical protein